MGISLGNQRLVDPSRRIDIALTREFQETLVQLLIGVLFVLIAASVSPSEIRDVLPESIVLILVMALVLRPLVVLLATWRSSFTWREPGSFAWIAPRGIVAGATASAFGLELQDEGVGGADLVLPIVFVVIFGTVVLYGLTAPLVARRARGRREAPRADARRRWPGTGQGSSRVALQQAGVAVRMWVGPPGRARRPHGQQASKPTAGRMMVDEVEREAELEDVTDALLITQSDDFNALAAAELAAGRSAMGMCLRVAPGSGGAGASPTRRGGRHPREPRADVSRN